MFIESHKVLVLSDAGTGLLGTASIDSNPDRTIADIKQFFRQLGINETSSTVVEVLVDSEPALGALLRRTGLTLQIRAAAPQAHETVGLAERNVRRFKEMVACIRSDMRAHGYDLTRNAECYHCVLQYMAQTHNHFGIGASTGQYENLSSRRSPIELVVQKNRPAPSCSLFGSVVHARVPDSLAAAIPEGRRFVPAAYLFIRPNSLSHVVSSKIGSDVHVFQSEIKPLSHDPSLAPALIIRRLLEKTDRRILILTRLPSPNTTRWESKKVFPSMVLPVLGLNIMGPRQIVRHATQPVGMEESTLHPVAVVTKSGSSPRESE